MIFLGTPHRGSGKSDLGLITSSASKALLHDANSSLIRDLRYDSQILNRVSEAFSRMLAKEEVQVYSFWEELGLTSAIGFRKVCNHLNGLNEDNLRSAGCGAVFSHHWRC